MRVLFIAYHFPPSTRTGSQRGAGFAKHLPEFGIEPVVFAGEAPGPGDLVDTTQHPDLEREMAVYRASGPAEARTQIARLRRLAGLLPASETRWREQINSGARVAAREQHVQAIFVTLSPFGGLAPAVELSEDLELPLIADLRDPWVLDEIHAYPSRLHGLIERARMGRLLDRCSMIIANTRQAAVAIAATFPGVESRLRVLTNGFSPADFEGLTASPTPDSVVIGHIGGFYSDLALVNEDRSLLKRALKGNFVEVDLLARTPFYLLKALDQLHQTHPDFASRIEVVLAGGELSRGDRRLINGSSFAVRNQVRELGYLKHSDAVQAMVGSDILFLPLHGVPTGLRARIVPGRTYEYLASGTPILAAVPDGDAKDLIEEFEAGVVVGPADVSTMAQAIIDLAEYPRVAPGGRPGLERFDRRELTRQLAEYLKELAGSS